MIQAASNSADSSVSAPSGELTSQVCASFEAAWQASDSPTTRPRLQDALAEIPLPDREAAFHSLLTLELRYRHARGEQPAPEEYYLAFPHDGALIWSVFEKTREMRTSSISGLADQP